MKIILESAFWDLQIMKAGGGRRGQLVLATEVPLQGSPNLHCLSVTTQFFIAL